MIRHLVELIILMNLALLLVLWAGSLISDRRRTHAQQDAHTDAGWLFDDPAFIDTLRREEDVWFAAEVLADIDELPEVRHG